MGNRSKSVLETGFRNAINKWTKLHHKPNLSEEFLHQIKRNIAELGAKKYTPRKVHGPTYVQDTTKMAPIIKPEPFFTKMAKKLRTAKDKVFAALNVHNRFTQRKVGV